MDGIEGRAAVFLMAASNRPDIIDPAVLRPGRLDKIVYVGLPNVEDRKDILRALTKVIYVLSFVYCPLFLFYFILICGVYCYFRMEHDLSLHLMSIYQCLVVCLKWKDTLVLTWLHLCEKLEYKRYESTLVPGGMQIQPPCVYL